MEYIFIYILIINILAFCLYGIDKWKAVRGAWRLSEMTLLLAAFLGGAAGAFLGMRIFHHKTRHWKFKILVPLFLILEILGLGYLYFIF
ncbi:DUF1294 domain-containing protein [Dialister sp.]|uniref:DUF1294 domain-containing protein n=1 Tax=Dialister sp. TaxID=1955814 RepID=UPI002E800C8E|nr:DUF1294 domain-containing protein [Dialister sp.]MEE3453120.1 DUF1294 domain-containing protein [Dialister sp.]